MTVIQAPSAIFEFTRWYLAIFYTCVAIFYTSKIVITQKSSAKALVFLGPRFCPTWWNHITFRLFRVSIWLVCVIRLFYPNMDNALIVFTDLASFPLILCGNILLTSGFVMTLVVHLSMGDTWRSGIDPNGPKFLLTTGYYGFSRNPIFVAVGVSQLGFFLALPSLFTLICLLIGLTTLYRQAVSEERHLSAAFPTQYKTYSATTRRWW